MTQFYIGCKQVEAWPECKDSDHPQELGYAVKYPDGYQSWCPKEVFEAAYLPMGKVKDTDNLPSEINANRTTQQMVDDFIVKTEVKTIGQKTTVVQATLANGFEIVESSSCVDVANYSESVGAEICLGRIKNQVWHLLGFALQWARTGLKSC